MEQEKKSENLENEVKLLFEIFRDKITDLRDGNKIMGMPAKLLISLYPQESSLKKHMDINVEIKIICPYDYPFKIPKFTIVKSNGLSPEDLDSLKKSIVIISNKLKGEIMLLDVAMYIEGFLYNIQSNQITLNEEDRFTYKFRNLDKPLPTNDHCLNPIQYRSFYHEMISNQRNKVIELEHEKLKKYEMLQRWREEQIAEVEKEMVKKKNYSSALINTTKLGHDNIPHAIHKISTKDSLGFNNNLVFLNGSLANQSMESNMPITYSNIVLGKIMSQSDLHTASMCHIKGEDEILFLKEYMLTYAKDANETDLQIFNDMLEGLAEHWSNLCAFNHPNLVRYLKIWCGICLNGDQSKCRSLVPYDSKLHSRAAFKFALLRQFVFGTPLVAKLKSPHSLDWTIFRNYVTQISSALVYLQANNVRCTELEPGHIYLDSYGAIKLVDFATIKRLEDLFENAKLWFGPNGNKERTGKYSFPKFSQFLNRDGPQNDVNASTINNHHLGELIVALITACHQSNLAQLCTNDPSQASNPIINGKVPSGTSVPTSLRPELKDFIKHCLDQNPVDVPVSEALFQLPFLRCTSSPQAHATPAWAISPPPIDDTNLCRNNEESMLQKGGLNYDHPTPDVEKAAHEPGQIIYTDKPVPPPTIAAGPSSHSRLLQDFHILEWVGRGGFGDVIKVRNELDDHVYAIKRIPLIDKSVAYRKLNRKITREIKLLSSLNHENIVRYYNSWFETFDDSLLHHFKGLFGETSPTTPVPGCVPDLTEPNIPPKVQKSVADPCLPKSNDLSDHIHKLTAFGKMDDPFFQRGYQNYRGDKCDETTAHDYQSSLTAEGAAVIKTPFTYSFFHYFSTDTENSSGSSSSSSSATSSPGYATSPRGRFDRNASPNDGPSVVFDSEIGDKAAHEQANYIATNEVTLHNNDTLNVFKCSSIEAAPSLTRRYICIQMEYCENNTLRKAIDDSCLYEQPQTAWRYYRETIEGLVYLHEQGIVHRDLKPVNIFLDFKDHIKIGDFGLATTQMFGKDILFEDNLPNKLSLAKNEIAYGAKQKSHQNEDFLYLSTKVGTALYVAPEISFSDGKIFKYNQKVDIYSLGIIFFEIWFPPAATSMERYKVLTNLRHPSINIPPSFEENYPNQTEILRWLLAHDPDRRPASKELLMSGHLPPLELEEIELDNVIQRAVNNPLSFPYRKIISSLFDQKHPSPTSDYAYDIDLKKNILHSNLTGPAEGGVMYLQKFSLPYKPSSASANEALYNHVRLGLVSKAHHSTLRLLTTEVFERHGAHHVSLPLLMPPCGALRDVLSMGIPLIERSGGLVTLPVDNRVALARYLAHNNILNLKRFSLDKVYKESKLIYTHPKECLELNFDIVTPSAQFSPLVDAEIIYTVQQIINLFPVLKERQYGLQLNHVSLILAVFAHLGIPMRYHTQILDIIVSAERKMRSPKVSVNQKLLAEIRCASGYRMQESCGLSPALIEELYDLFNVEEINFPKMAQIFTAKLKPKKGSEVYNLLDRGLKDIEAMLVYLKVLGFDLPIYYGLKMGLLSNPSYKYCSGLLFIVINMSTHHSKIVDKKFLALNNPSLKNASLDILATGGRYDKLLRTFQFSAAPNENDHSGSKAYTIQSIWKDPQEYNFTNCPHAVGLSISFDKMLTAYVESHSTMTKEIHDRTIKGSDALYDYLILLYKGEQRRSGSEEAGLDPAINEGKKSNAQEKGKSKRRRRPARHKPAKEDGRAPFNYDNVLMPLLARVMKMVWDRGQTLNILYLEVETPNDLDEVTANMGLVCKNVLIFSPDYLINSDPPRPSIEEIPFVIKSWSEEFDEKHITLADLADLCKSLRPNDNALKYASLSQSCQDISSSNVSLNTLSNACHHGNRCNKHGHYLPSARSTSFALHERTKEVLEDSGNLGSCQQHCSISETNLASFTNASCSGSKCSASAFASIVNITFVTSEKLSAYIKRKYETQIISKLYDNSPLVALPATSHASQPNGNRPGKTVIEVVAVELNASVIKAFCAYFNFSPNFASISQGDNIEVALPKNQMTPKQDSELTTFVYEKYPKSRKPLSQIVEHLQKLKSVHKDPFFCLIYCYKDNFYKIL